MKSRGIVSAITVGFLALGAWLALRPAGPPSSPAGSTPSAPVVTRTGEVIPRDASAPGGPDAPPPTTPAATVGPRSAGVTGTPTPMPRIAASLGQTAAADKDPERAAAMGELGKVRRMIGDYHTLMDENPVGTNAEIMRALMGHNPRQAMLGPPEGQTLNDRGELVDPWGTPYFFHQLSRDRMEVHSAGPDRIMGTSDDLVVK